MLFHIFDPGVSPDEETVNTVVLGVLVSAVVNPAACDDHHIRVLADKEVVIDHFLQPALGHDHGDVHALVFRARLDPDLQPAHIFLGNNLDVCRGLPPGGRAVGADVVGAFRHFVQIGHFSQQPLLDLVQFQHSASPFPAGLYGPSHTSAISARIRCG